MSAWSVGVAVTYSRRYEVEADDVDEARDAAIEAAFDDYALADDYEVVWDPEPVRS